MQPEADGLVQRDVTAFCSPENAVGFSALSKIDVREPSAQTPTLVFHSRKTIRRCRFAGAEPCGNSERPVPLESRNYILLADEPA
jgi:hypothetical protein